MAEVSLEIWGFGGNSLKWSGLPSERRATHRLDLPKITGRDRGSVQGLGDDGELEQNLKGDDVEGGLVGGLQDDGAAGSGAMHVQPACRADTPAVAGAQAGKAELRHGRGEVITQARGDLEELRRHDAADRVHAEVVNAGVAAAVAIEARERVRAAGLQWLAEDVFLGRELGAGGIHAVIVEQVVGCRFLF